MAKDESGKRHKGSIIERVAKRVSSDLSADIAREDMLPSNGGADDTASPADGTRRPAAPVEGKTLDDPLPNLGAADAPLLSVPGRGTGPETPRGSRRPAWLGTKSSSKSDLVGHRIKLDLSGLSATGYVTPNAARSRTTEQYRLIKRAILNRHWNEASPRSNVVMITSALPDEGKTFTAINLAMSMTAEEDMSILLIDADFNKQGIVTALGIHKKIGLIDVLENPDIDFADVLLKTNISNLTIMPAGRPRERSTELLAGATMAQLAEEMAGRYKNRFILIDCPPLLVATEAGALTAHVGQVLVVVRAEATKEPAVRHALEMIDGTPEVGLVLNRSRPQFGSSEFGDYKAVDYGYGSQKPN